MLAADVNRFGGANQTALWNAFAKRGFGQSAQTATTDVGQPEPGFDSPRADNATVTFRAVKPNGDEHLTRFFVGSFEARATPAADTITNNDNADATIEMAPGTYEMLAQSRGYGIRPFTLTVTPGEHVTKTVQLQQNWASDRLGATATGAGTDQDLLLDDKQATQWEVTGLAANVDVARPSVIVDLGGGDHMVRSVQVSAFLSPGQGRFTALRRFRIDTCEASTGVTCNTAADFHPLYTSPADAFPGVAPRPVAPDLLLRTFDVPDTMATHVRLVALENQCTGGPDYAGEQDNDPLNPTDCATGSDVGTELHAAELEVRSSNSP
jgi:hypothetical protein